MFEKREKDGAGSHQSILVHLFTMSNNNLKLHKNINHYEEYIFQEKLCKEKKEIS